MQSQVVMIPSNSIYVWTSSAFFVADKTVQFDSISSFYPLKTKSKFGPRDSELSIGPSNVKLPAVADGKSDGAKSLQRTC